MSGKSEGAVRVIGFGPISASPAFILETAGRAQMRRASAGGVALRVTILRGMEDLSQIFLMID